MNKVVVTGYGIKAPKTPNIKQFLTNLKEGIHCLQLDDQLTPKGESTIIGVIDDGLLDNLADPKYKRLSRTTILGIEAGVEALKSANLDSLENKKVGIFFGTSVGNIQEDIFQEAIVYAKMKNHKKIPVTFGHYANYHSITSAIAYFLGVKGITKTISTGCTSSLEALQDAVVYLKSGQIDYAIVGGSDSPITEVATYGFAKTRVLPLNQSIDEGAVAFQSSSKGFALSEGAGFIILERQEVALERNAKILGEINRVSSNNDGTYLFTQEETGTQMLAALKDVTQHRKPDYINSQALGIQINDLIEKQCSKALFNHKVPYTSIKSMIGNPLGAIGIIQVISALLSINNNFIPPTIHTNKLGFEEMNIVTTTQVKEIREVAITTHGYGGNNACAYVMGYPGKV
ncbi:beta-ketoacyl synthase N-terminal-like domain-containing protein [Bacillus sp. FJAT-45037]|uniref:beta-ketoacyl synthase N-terminal-like domain-containing protein n=1 Tax=Bacillus sp. FJAT-45037 TaxID=2011007 RepID=UPI000C250CC9|nr:beta-ketoacyl synthase N-terminal-like domain-containing protein [Bacillus sp. FJAT-45037]